MKKQKKINHLHVRFLPWNFEVGHQKINIRRKKTRKNKKYWEMKKLTQNLKMTLKKKIRKKKKRLLKNLILIMLKSKVKLLKI